MCSFQWLPYKPLVLPARNPIGRASLERERFRANAREQTGFGCSESIGMDMAGVVVAVGEDSDPMYGSVMWGIVQGTYAQYALLTCSLTVRALSDKGSRWIGFSFSQQDVEKTISLEGSAKILVDGAL